MPPVGWLHRHFRVSPAIITRPSPPGLAALQTVLGELRFSRPCKDTATEPLRKLTERLQDAHECLRALTGTSGFHRTPPGVHRTPPGVHRRSIPHGRDFRDPPHDPQQHGQLRLSTGRLRSTNRCVVLATSILGCSPELQGSNRVPSGDSRSQARPNSPFNGDSIVSLLRTIVRRPLAEMCNVSGATVVTFESTPGFRLSYRR